MQKIEILGLDKFSGRNILSGFYVNSIADHLAQSHRHIEKPHKHDFYATMIFTSGSGSHSIDFNLYDVRPGRIFMMSPGQVHHWELSGDADGFIFFHTKEFYEMRFSDEKLSGYAFFSQGRKVDTAQIPLSEIENFVHHFRQMSDAHFADEKTRRHFLISHITQIYIEIEELISDEKPSEKPSAYTAKFNRFVEILEQNFRSEKSPEKYAGFLNVSAKHLNRINRETVSKSTSEIILDRVLLEAKRKLIYSEGSHAEIASALGYDDYAYFSKLFKKKTGMTPSEFQKRFR